MNEPCSGVVDCPDPARCDALGECSKVRPPRPQDGADAFAFAFWGDPKRYTAVVCRACYGEVPQGCKGIQEHLKDCWRKRYRLKEGKRYERTDYEPVATDGKAD